MADGPKKRAAPDDGADGQRKKKQKRRNWFCNHNTKGTIEPGDAGIFVTCNRNIERRCVGECKDLFNERVKQLHPGSVTTSDAAEDDEDEDEDVEAAIKAELTLDSKSTRLFEHVNLDQKCLLFFRTRSPLDPVPFVHNTCTAASTKSIPRTRFIKRLTPLSLTGPATESGLQSVARKVLHPHFHAGGVERGVKFAIRPTIRDHNKGLNSKVVIELVAKEVGKGHVVDLKGYDLLILVEVFKNICGMSVVSDFEKLKKYNLSEIWEPTPKPQLDELKSPEIDVPATSHEG